MKYRIYLLVLSSVMVLISTGCSKIKFYAVDRPRVDQANMGNAGYVAGEKKDDGSIDGRPTRRIYVFEVDRKKKPQPAAEKQTAVSQEPVSQDPVQAANGPAQTTKKGLTIPYIGDDEPGVEGASSVDVSGALYTVVKDDTLQKISKKVYGSFGKWTKIYDANKDKIKNPNFVKPGIVLVIPALD